MFDWFFTPNNTSSTHKPLTFLHLSPVVHLIYCYNTLLVHNEANSINQRKEQAMKWNQFIDEMELVRLALS